jgi:hypothetical protein
MNVQRMYAIEDKIAFRHDPFMLHQTNAATFYYEDPAPDARFTFGSAYNTSLVGLYMQRVLGDMMLYYNLPSKLTLLPLSLSLPSPSVLFILTLFCS